MADNYSGRSWRAINTADDPFGRNHAILCENLGEIREWQWLINSRELRHDLRAAMAHNYSGPGGRQIQWTILSGEIMRICECEII